MLYASIYFNGMTICFECFFKMISFLCIFLRNSLKFPIVIILYNIMWNIYHPAPVHTLANLQCFCYLTDNRLDLCIFNRCSSLAVHHTETGQTPTDLCANHALETHTHTHVVGTEESPKFPRPCLVNSLSKSDINKDCVMFSCVCISHIFS